MILNVVNVPFWFVPEPSTPSELDVPFVGSCIAECLWPFLFDVPWLPDDPVEEENGDINPVFLMVELNEPMTASTCIILKAFLSFLYDDMCKFFFNFCLSLFFSSLNIPIKNLLVSIWSSNDVRLHLLNQYVWNWYGRTIDYKINYFISTLLPLQGQNEWKWFDKIRFFY